MPSVLMMRLRAFRLIHRLFVLKILNLRTAKQVNLIAFMRAARLTRLEVLDVLVGDLGDLEQADGAVVVDEGTTLDIGLGLVRDLHDELGLGVDHVLQDLLVHTGKKSWVSAYLGRYTRKGKYVHGAQVIRVGDEEVLLALREELVEDT